MDSQVRFGTVKLAESTLVYINNTILLKPVISTARAKAEGFLTLAVCKMLFLKKRLAVQMAGSHHVTDGN